MNTSIVLNSLFTHIIMVSERSRFVNTESTSKVSISKPTSCSQINLANSTESYKVKPLEFRRRNKRTKKLPFISTCVKNRQNKS